MSTEHEAAVVACLRDYKPRLVLAPISNDRHPDHAASAELVKRAAFFAGVAKTGEGPPHRIERILHYAVHAPFIPSLVFDVSPVWRAYEEVIAAYRSQFFPAAAEGGAADDGGTTALSAGGFLKTLDARARHYGAMIGVDHGEAYHAASPLAVDSPASLLRPAGSRPAYGSFY